jgi:hypothetical protein
MEQPDFDEEFEQAIADWREKHRLREDDAALLLVELFRIHQRHWDELRRREMPSFEQFRGDITKLAEAARIFQQQGTTLSERIQKESPGHQTANVSRGAAIIAAIITLLAGYFFGRAWP